MIGFWTPHLLFFKSNDKNNENNHKHHVFSHHHGDRCVPVTFDISSPQKFESSSQRSSFSTTTAHSRHHDGTTLAAAVATVIFFLMTTATSSVSAWVPTTTTFQPSLRTTTTTTSFHHHRHVFTRDSPLRATTADTTATMENLSTNDAVSTRSPQQQQQSILLAVSPQPTAVASWLFAPTVLSLLAVPSAASAAAATTSPFQEAWNNLIGATLPESTPDLISVMVGEGMGYLTYFGVTAMLVASVWQQNQNQQQQQHQHDAENVIIEYDDENNVFEDPMNMMVLSSSSQMTDNDHHHHVMLFEPVSSTEEDALVPCAFMLEQAQALEQQHQQETQTQTHQSLLHHLDWVEVFFDVTKWLSYFVMMQSDLRGTPLLQNNVVLESAIFGFVAGFGAKFYADILYRHLGQGPEHKRREMTQQPWPLACFLEGMSAASLFAVYEAVQEPVQNIMTMMMQ